MKVLRLFRTMLMAVALVVAAIGCSKIDKPSPEKPDNPNEVTPVKGNVTVSFTSTAKTFPNPERGFYNVEEFHFKDGKIPSRLSSGKANVMKAVNRTVLLTEYYLTDFMDGDISEEALKLIGDNLAVARETGLKCILRFAYKNNESNENKPWDPEEKIVLRHIAQLKPVLQANSDVIYVLQAGFVGVWGEWYYTDHFGFEPSSDADYIPRRHVLDALLDALPSTRQIAVRTPAFGMKCFGLSVKDTITASIAHTAEARARIAGHNDAFLYNGGDMGTFFGDDDRAFWKNNTKYMIMGGESAGIGAAVSSSKENSIKALSEYHWSYCNSEYNPEVLGKWRKDGIYDEIDRRLGYRLVMKEASVPKTLEGGVESTIQVKIGNEGFASVMNPHGCALVLESASGADRQVFDLKEADPRKWMAGKDYVISRKITPKGSGELKGYNLYLWIYDSEPSLKDKPSYSIRTANENTWNQSKGMNLIHSF